MQCLADGIAVRIPTHFSRMYVQPLRSMPGLGPGRKHNNNDERRGGGEILFEVCGMILQRCSCEGKYMTVIHILHNLSVKQENGYQVGKH